VWLRRGTVLRSFVRDAVDGLLVRVAGSSEGARTVRQAVEQRYRELHSAWKARRRRYEAPADARGFALERLNAHFEERALESDALHLPPGRRLVASSRVDALGAKELDRKGRSTEVLAEAARARSELLREERCAELLTRAGALEVRVARVEPPAAQTLDDGAGDEASASDLGELLEASSRARRG
jgi:hypothetical protein